jgi:hypothetical protein
VNLFLVYSILSFLFCIIIGILSYKKLRSYHLKGSVLADLSIMLEKSLLRFQSLIFPLFFIIIIGSFVIGGFGSNPDDNIISIFLPMIGIILPFLGLVSISMIFFDYIDNNNNKVVGLSEKIIPDELRSEIKIWGEKLGINDVKIRLGDLIYDDYCNHSWSVFKNNAALIVYSSITFQKTTNEQNIILVNRELFRIKNKNSMPYLLAIFIRNINIMLSFFILGGIIINYTNPTWNSWITISNADLTSLIITVVLNLFAIFFIKTYIDTFELLNELKTDSDTINFLSKENFDKQEIKRTLLQSTKINPLIQETRGLEFRINSLNNAFPDSHEKKKTGISWEDL